ncbi:MAG: hypothetical protein U0K87_00145 [Ruminococcus sp.]|nr:hypothetical protein [Ruminococcus sp.]
MRHIIDGYRFMTSLGCDDCAQICLTHSFPYKDILSYNGQNDCTAEETEFIKSFIENTKYDDYDKLIQLCDDLTIPKWKAFLELKDYFDKKTETDIYKLIGV